MASEWFLATLASMCLSTMFTVVVMSTSMSASVVVSDAGHDVIGTSAEAPLDPIITPIDGDYEWRMAEDGRGEGDEAEWVADDYAASAGAPLDVGCALDRSRAAMHNRRHRDWARLHEAVGDVTLEITSTCRGRSRRHQDDGHHSNQGRDHSRLVVCHRHRISPSCDLLDV